MLIRATIRMNHGTIRLSGRGQTQKAMYCMIPFIEMSRIGQSVEKPRRGGSGSDCLMGFPLD